MKRIICVLFLSIFPFIAFPQKGKTRILFDSLLISKNFKDYSDQKMNSEVLIKNFKQESHNKKDNSSVKTAYDRLKIKSDNFLDKIENDLSAKKKRKSIIKSPSNYLKSKDEDFSKITQIYNYDFLGSYNKVDQSASGGAGLDDIPFDEILKFILSILKETEVTKEFIKENFTDALRFKDWDTI